MIFSSGFKLFPNVKRNLSVWEGDGFVQTNPSCLWRQRVGQLNETRKAAGGSRPPWLWPSPHEKPTEQAVGQHEERHRAPFQQLSGLCEVTLSRLLCKATNWPKRLPTFSTVVSFPVLWDTRVNQHSNTPYFADSGERKKIATTKIQTKKPSLHQRTPVSTIGWTEKHPSHCSSMFNGSAMKSTDNSKDHFTLGILKIEFGAWELFLNGYQQSPWVTMSRRHPNGAPR